MKNINAIAITASTAAAGLTAAIPGLAAPAAATETSSGSAQQTIASLEAKGNRVIVSNPNNTPLAEATVVSVRKGNDVTGWTWDSQHEDQFKTVLYTNYFVDVR